MLAVKVDPYWDSPECHFT